MGFTNISLFSGIGGIELGLGLAVPALRTVAYVEREAYCCEILATRMEEECIPPAPIWTDVTTFDGRPWRGLVDCLSGGFPCQDISNAGKRAGIGGERSGLWFEYVRLIREVGPTFVFVENVAALVQRGLSTVLGSLAELGFDAEWDVFTAAEVGAPHLRKRLFILAYDNSCRLSEHVQFDGHASQATADRRACGEHADGRDPALAHSGGERRQQVAGGAHGHESADAWWSASYGHKPASDGPDVAYGSGTGYDWSERREERPGRAVACKGGLYPPGPSGDWTGISSTLEPAVRGVANGVPYRVDRLRALGNGVVPDVAALAWRTLYGRLCG